MRVFEKIIAFALLGVVIGALVWVGFRWLWDPNAIVLSSDAEQPWIAVAEPVTASIRQWRNEEVAKTGFGLSFEGDAVPGPARLSFRALGAATIRLNGEEVFGGEASARASANWKSLTFVELGNAIRPGPNRLVVEIENARGPGLLSLRLEGAGGGLATGRHWRGWLGSGPPGPVWLADDTRPHLSAHRAETAAEGFLREAGTLMLLFLGGAIAFVCWQRLAAPEAGSGLVGLALASVVLVWIVLFGSSFAAIPLAVGFDAGSHLQYERLLWDQGALPMATDGFSTYHPPLFYALAGAAGAGLGELGVPLEIGRKLIPFLSGLGLAALAFAFSRRLFPDEPAVVALSVLFAGFLPMNLTQAAYFGNEGLHAALAAAAVFLALDLLLRESLSTGRLACFSFVLGLALLTKFTAFLVAALAGGALLLKIAVAARLAPAVRMRAFAALVLPALVVAGWFYVRNVLLYGSAVHGNWDFSGPGLDWWTQPGFHTAAYYGGFGASLTRPFLSGFESFWDALYSTLWGDGFLAGQGGPGARHAHWNYALMATVYPLALPATALCAWGYLRGAFLALRDPAGARRSAFALLSVLCAATFFAIFWLTLSLPYFGQAKAFYGLLLTPLLGLYMAMGFARLDEWLASRRRWLLRAVLYGWATALLGAIVLAFAG